MIKNYLMFVSIRFSIERQNEISNVTGIKCVVLYNYI